MPTKQKDKQVIIKIINKENAPITAPTIKIHTFGDKCRESAKKLAKWFYKGNASIAFTDEFTKSFIIGTITNNSPQICEQLREWIKEAETEKEI